MNIFPPSLAKRTGSVFLMLAAVMSFIALGASASGAATKSTTYPIKVGSITLTFPSKPVSTSVKVNTAAGLLDVPLWTIDAGQVIASGVPLPGLTKTNATNILSSSLAGAVTNVQGTLRNSKADTYIGFPSTTGIIDVAGGTTFIRIVIDTKTSTLIQMVGVVPKPKAKTPPASYTKLVASGKRA